MKVGTSYTNTAPKDSATRIACLYEASEALKEMLNCIRYYMQSQDEADSSFWLQGVGCWARVYEDWLRLSSIGEKVAL